MRIVDLPEPEGPEMTIGWWAARAAASIFGVSVGAMVEELNRLWEDFEVVER